VKNPPAYGERDAVKVGDGTGEVSPGRWASCRNRWYKREAKSRGKPGEKSEEAIVLMTTETTQLGEREGPLLQPCRAGR